MNCFNQKYKSIDTLVDKLNALSLREQLLVMVTGLAVIVTSIYEMNITPYMSKVKVGQAELIRLQTEELVYQQEIAYLQSNWQNQHQQLQKQNVSLDMQLQALNLSFAKVDATPNILAGVLSDFKGLELVALESLPATQYGHDALLLKRPYKLHFVGQFPNVIKYLYRLKEDVPSVFWEYFEYNIQKFPEASIKLTLFSLDYIEKDKVSRGSAQ